MKSFSFCLSEKFFVPPSILKDNCSGQSILGCRVFPFRTLHISCHSFLACKVSPEKSVDSLLVIHLYMTLFLSFCFQNSLFIFNFCHFNYDMSQCGSVYVHLAAARADLFLPCLKAKTVHEFLMSGIQASHSRSNCPNSPLMSRGFLSPPHKTPGLKHPIYVSHCLLPRADVCPCNLPSSLGSLPQAHVPTLLLFFPSYLITCVSFLES